MKSEKSFFDFEKNDEYKSFDDDESNTNDESSANTKSSVNAKNLFDDINENENQIDFAKNSQKKRTR